MCRWFTSLVVWSKVSLSLSAFLLVGCSEMKFVTAVSQAKNGEDEAENVQVTGVRAEFTSGTTVQTRVIAQKGILHDSRGVLVLTQPLIEMPDRETTRVASTRATTATFYLSSDKKEKREKSDFVLTGNVTYSLPMKDDPSTVALVVETSHLVWNSLHELFESDSPYRMIMNPPGKPPIVALGDAFVASRDLRHWNVRHGGIGTNTEKGDFRKQNEVRRRELESVVNTSAEVESQSSSRDSAESGVQLPEEMVHAERELTGGTVSSDGASSQPARVLHRLPMR
jgi:hypothetical protein